MVIVKGTFQNFSVSLFRTDPYGCPFDSGDTDPIQYQPMINWMELILPVIRNNAKLIKFHGILFLDRIPRVCVGHRAE